ncbi:hypothetical protein Btru_071149 [Bulinus truncatus]|nr:hypothetical protein Btru_071149 [Bulinus truncatus]
MALPDGFTFFHCVGLGLLFTGNLLHLIGLATPGWTIGTTSYERTDKNTYLLFSGTYYIGLWKMCFGECVDGNNTGAWKAAEAFALLGMIFGLASLAAALLYFLTRLVNKNKLDLLQLVAAVAGITSFVLIIIGVSCYGGGVHGNFEWTDKYIGYSLVLSIIGGIIILIGGLTFYFPRFRKNSSTS